MGTSKIRGNQQLALACFDLATRVGLEYYPRGRRAGGHIMWTDYQGQMVCDASMMDRRQLGLTLPLEPPLPYTGEDKEVAERLMFMCNLLDNQNGSTRTNHPMEFGKRLRWIGCMMED